MDSALLEVFSSGSPAVGKHEVYDKNTTVGKMNQQVVLITSDAEVFNTKLLETLFFLCC